MVKSKMKDNDNIILQWKETLEIFVDCLPNAYREYKHAYRECIEELQEILEGNLEAIEKW